jgi:hypothetical protein
MQRTRKIVYVAPEYQVKKNAKKRRINKKEVVNHIPNFHKSLAPNRDNLMEGFSNPHSSSFRLGPGEESMDNQS